MTKRTTFGEVQKQSQRAMDRWGEIWRSNAKKNSEAFEYYDPLIGLGTGRKCIIIAYGPSFEENVDKIIYNKLQYEYDIICVDKALKHLLKKGVIPQYVMCCDAQVDFYKYGNIKPWQVKNTKLLLTITANHKWAAHWKKHGGEFHIVVNKDNIRTQKEFRPLLDNKQHYLIPAASNVANSAYVCAVLVMKYTQIMLAAFDYSYTMKGGYYGDTKDDPKDTNYKERKKTFNNHFSMMDIKGEMRNVSGNMDFSCRWLVDFIMQMSKLGIQTVNITEHGMLTIPWQARLEAA